MIVEHLAASALGAGRARAAVATMTLDPALLASGEEVTRAQVAMALDVVLFARSLDDVPSGARYVQEAGRTCFDHGALRTIDGETGALPRGAAAFARLLEPLGYRLADLYPLPRLRMTGHVFTHADLPETIPQFFVSELHVSELPDDAQAAAARVFGGSVDPLGPAEQALLAALAAEGSCSPELAQAGLPGLAAAFGRHHPEPALADYETLLAASAEAGWIATEGNVFNHATDRVPDVVALAESLKARGYPIKDTVEHSASGRVHQTALLADKVTRRFRLPDGGFETRAVPGSFYEFITRDVDPETGGLDLRFDSGNATGIFAVTRAA